MNGGRPLLLANRVVYDGPWTLTRDLEGDIRVTGMVSGEDEVVICIRDPNESESDVVITVQKNVEMNIGEITKALIQAKRTISSGSEVAVWVS